MGVLEFFGTLIKNDITASAIKSNYTDRTTVNHLLMDFNSIIHVASQKVILDVNILLQLVLKNLYTNRGVSNIVFTEKFEKYSMVHIQKKINQNSDPNEVIKMFQRHFTDEYMDRLVITLVINTVLRIVRTFCNNKGLQTLMLAIDGVPSKGKMVEQKQRRYMGAITEAYKKKILSKYKQYLLEQPDYIYEATTNGIKWSRNKITPGTAFMHKLVNYLRSDSIQAKFKVNRHDLQVVVSDMYEVGEGEKKIVNYVIKYLANTNESVMVYSPDADVILLCMLLPVTKLYMLRHNQQTSAQSGSNIYDLIDIRMLKSNIGYYINNHPDYAKEEFDSDRINYDIVCISTLFGNDFVPKIETMNVKKGFNDIMNAYLRSLIALKSKGYYLVKEKNSDGEFRLNFTFLKKIFTELIPEEMDFIKHNRLYREYITIGQIKNVFDYMEINSENLVSTFNGFRSEYENLKNLIKGNGNLLYYETYDQFMNSLKKSLLIIMDGQAVNTSYLTNKDMIKLLRDYWRKYRDFPRLNINLNTWSHSIGDYKHKLQIKDKHYNEYQKEVYKFENMLDEYYIKFNAQPLQLSKDKIGSYYEDYFGVKLYNGSSSGNSNASSNSRSNTRFNRSSGNSNGSSNSKLSAEATQVMHDYVEGLLWVFNYYFNDMSYVNTWYYAHERAPLMQHILMFLNSISLEYFTDLYKNLVKYKVDDLARYFNPIEQLIYVSPMTHDIIKLLPANYRKYIESDNLDPFLRNYFLDINEIANQMWREKVSHDVDCRSIPYFNKCLIKSISKPTKSDDKQFLKAIRKVEPTDVSERRSKSTEPDY